MSSFVIYIESKCPCPSPFTVINSFVNTKAYPFVLIGTTPSSLNSTLFEWEAVKVCWFGKSETNKLYLTSSALTPEDRKT